MNFTYHERTLTAVLLEAAEQFPAVVVTGPRQSGKTTLVRHLFGSSHAYCSLDDIQLRELARSDPQGLLSRFPPPVILDEIQYVPEILRNIKADIDENRSGRGRYVLTGSQVFPLMQDVGESLAGRTAVLTLESMSLRETLRLPEPETSWRRLLLPDEPSRTDPGSSDSPVPTSPEPPSDPERLARSILRGGFPDPALDQDLNATLWYSSYLQTYLERDVRTLRAVGDLHDFQRFLLALAARTGGLINQSDLARDLGLSGKTVAAWLSVLEASSQIHVLKPYHESLGKRLVKRPKAYFLDTGVLGYLLGIETTHQVLRGMAAGPLFEAAVFGQLYRLFLHRGIPPRIFFWRTAAGHEVDFVIDCGEELIPVEARLTSTPRLGDAASIRRFQELFGARAGHGILVCMCSERHVLDRGVTAVPFGSF